MRNVILLAACLIVGKLAWDNHYVLTPVGSEARGDIALRGIALADCQTLWCDIERPWLLLTGFDEHNRH